LERAQRRDHVVAPVAERGGLAEQGVADLDERAAARGRRRCAAPGAPPRRAATPPAPPSPSRPRSALRARRRGSRAVRAGLAALSLKTLRRRFGYRFVPEERHVAWVAELGRGRHVAIGACIDGRTPVGLARAVIEPAGEQAEVAATVLDAWQRQGIGSALVDAPAARLAAAGVRVAGATVAVENGAAIAAMRSIGGRRVGPISDGAIVMQAALGAGAAARRRSAGSGR
jgi:GNAT superfamily N-acetyltransferase